MKQKGKIILCIIGFLAGFFEFNKAYSTDKNKAESQPREKKALLEADFKNGIKLSSTAQKALGLRFAEVSSQPIQIVPKSALVYFQSKIGIYRYRSDFFKLTEVEVLSGSETEAKIKSNEIVPGDKVVIQGVPLLRVAELDAFAGPGDAD